MPRVALVAPTTVPGVQGEARPVPVESYQDGPVMRLPRGWGSVGATLFCSSVVADDQLAATTQPVTLAAPVPVLEVGERVTGGRLLSHDSW